MFYQKILVQAIWMWNPSISKKKLKIDISKDERWTKWIKYIRYDIEP